MGMKLHYYIGPYLTCGLKNNKKIPHKRKLNSSCFNKNCKEYCRYIFTKFCSGCGGAVTEGYEETFKDSIDINKVEEQVDGNLSSFLSVGGQCECSYAKDNNLHIWTANLNVDAIDEDFNEDDHEYMPTVDGEMIEKHKNAFIKQFEKEIATIKKVYGEDQVEVDWGIFYYYM